MKKKMKTFQEKLQILEKQIRKAPPRLIELSEGFLLRDKITNQILKIIYLKEDRFSFVNIKTGDVSSNNLVKNIDEDFEIIGHDILLSDVLEWFDNLKHETIRVSQITTKGTLIGTENTDTLRAVKFGKWDLSKPHLKDQSEELINFLYSLTENN